MDTYSKFITECFVSLVVSELENGSARHMYEHEKPLVHFYLGMFLEDYEGDSLLRAIQTFMMTIHMVNDEFDRLKESQADHEEIRELMQHRTALQTLGRAIYDAKVIVRA